MIGTSLSKPRVIAPLSLIEPYVRQAVVLMALMFIIGVSAASGAAVPLYNGLIGHWSLSENAGTIAHDTAPFGSIADNGTVRNGASWIDGLFGNGLQFNGTNQSVLVPSSTDLNLGAAGLTLSAWIKLDQLPASLPAAYGGIFDSAPDSYVMYLDKSANELRFKVTTSNGAAARPAVPASMLNTTDWLHVMGVYDGAGRASIYFNGNLIDSLAASNLTGPVVSGQVATIGADAGVNVGSTSGTARYFFPGAIADVALWNRPLGLAESQYLYNGGTGRSIASGNPSIEPIVPTPPGNRRVLVEAHRGNSVAAPENTLAAFNAAAGFADLVEFDVHVSQDGRLVVMHDSTLSRTTNGTGSVSSRNYVGYIDGLDAGSWFSPQFAGEPVPTMSQAVENILGNKMIPLIERKAGTAAQFVTELTNMGVIDDVAIIAFDWNFLSNVRALNPDVRLGGLGSGTLSSTVIANALNAGLDFIDWGDGSSINPSTIDLVHNAGLEMHVWTVNNLARMQQLIDLGVDGITTDDPEGLRMLVGWPPPGDFDGDGDVDGSDFAMWQTGFPKTSGATLQQGDADGDGDVDGADFVVWQTNFAMAGGQATTSVPEPGALSMALLAVVAAVCAIRRTGRSL